MRLTTAASRGAVHARLDPPAAGPRTVKKITAHWIDGALLRDFEAEKTDAHRLATTTDGWVERFGRDILISFRTSPAREQLTLELHLWAENVGFDCGRIFIRFLPRRNEERGQPQLLFGDAAENLQTAAMERQLKFGIDFAGGYSVGLFVDQRENRAYLRKLAPARVLNCFAYTCSFAVAAAAAGATTLNVDLSRKALDHGRANFALNSLTTHGHQFIADDVLKVLPRLARRGEKFDAIILDPPTFAHRGTGKTFRVERDFEQLLLMALEVAARDGHILLATNCSQLGRQSLEVLARYCLKTARRAAKFVHLPALPDFPHGAGASSLWLSLR